MDGRSGARTRATGTVCCSPHQARCHHRDRGQSGPAALAAQQRLAQSAAVLRVGGIRRGGENLEHAARREAKEETGIDLGEVRYLGSQPWPFPASLMMAFKAQALNTDILVDGEETETARWVTRDEYTIELSEGRMEAPGKSTIARYMIEEWYGREL